MLQSFDLLSATPPPVDLHQRDRQNCEESRQPNDQGIANSLT